jgi:hypothetical protein
MSNRRVVRPLAPLFFIAGLLLAPVIATSADVSAAPEALWVAVPEDPGAIEAARAGGVRVRDAFPDALVLDSAEAVAKLRESAFRISGPFAVGPGEGVVLVRARRAELVDATPGPADLALEASVRLLWMEGRNALLAVGGGELPAGLASAWGPKALSPIPLPAPVPPPPSRETATVFAPVIDGMVAQVDEAATFRRVEELSGAEPAWIGGNPYVFTTRYTTTSMCDAAEQYVYQKFQAMGYTDVAFDPFLVFGTPARNVIATLPGTVSPESEIIVCGHLDSTSPEPTTDAPGANDNASGTAVVLAAAEILEHYAFEKTIRFIAFTGEEQGLYGSYHYVQEAMGNGDQIDGVLNCDMVAYWSSSYEVQLESEIFASSLVSVVDDACTAYTGLGTQNVWGAWGSDHAPFLDAGYPALLVIEDEWSSYPCYHSTCDTAGMQDTDMLADVTRAVVAAAAHLAVPSPATSVAGSSGPTALDLVIGPNPTVGSAAIRYAIPVESSVHLTVHDVGGRLLRTIVNGLHPAGAHATRWDGRTRDGTAVGAGVYFLRLETGDRVLTERLVRIR